MIAKHLRPAHAEILGDAREAARELAAIEHDAATIATSGTERQLDAWRRLAALSVRYDAIMAAAAAIRAIRSAKSRDADNEYTEFRRGARAAGRLPSEPAARMAHIATSDAEAWLPTMAEQDAAWVGSDLAEAVRDQQQRRRAELRL